MIPERIDVSILCSICNKPVERREMAHLPAEGKFKYTVHCHGDTDVGPHLETPSDKTSHGKVLMAFPGAAQSKYPD